MDMMLYRIGANEGPVLWDMILYRIGANEGPVLWI